MNHFNNTLFPHSNNNFFLIAGPCVVEDDEMAFSIADKVSSICKRLEIPYIFKASYRKANRTSANSFTGIGDENSTKITKNVYASPQRIITITGKNKEELNFRSNKIG